MPPIWKALTKITFPRGIVGARNHSVPHKKIVHICWRRTNPLQSKFTLNVYIRRIILYFFIISHQPHLSTIPLVHTPVLSKSVGEFHNHIPSVIVQQTLHISFKMNTFTSVAIISIFRSKSPNTFSTCSFDTPYCFTCSVNAETGTPRGYLSCSDRNPCFTSISTVFDASLGVASIAFESAADGFSVV